VTLLDSNTIIHYLRGDEWVVPRMQGAVKGTLGIPSLVMYEIEYGTLRARSARRRAILTEALADLVHIPFDQEAALESARVRVELEELGLVIGPVDFLIAGTALSRGAVLATNNIKEFSRVRGLRLEDWTLPLDGRRRTGRSES
jgi:tRNA(fMet)-specific endonuclease VapC